MRKFTSELFLSSLKFERLEVNQISVKGKKEVELFFFKVRIILQGAIPYSIVSLASGKLDCGHFSGRHFLDLIVLDKGFDFDAQKWIILQLFANILSSIFPFEFPYEFV